MDKEPKITDFINGKVEYDSEGQQFWIHRRDNGIQLLGELRGWGHIQHMPHFRLSEGKFDVDLAGRFQDEVGEFIAKAINEKLATLIQGHIKK